MAGMLYLVPTPIGNLSDISARCRKTFEEADFIAAEDTRVTLKLLNFLELKKPLVSYYEHNKLESGPKIVRRIHLRPRRRLSPPVRRSRADGLRNSGPVCTRDGAFHLRPSDGKILLRGFFVHQQKKPARAPVEP